MAFLCRLILCSLYRIVGNQRGDLFIHTQINTWLDRPYDRLSLTGPHTTAQEQVQAALHAVPGATLSAYELPKDQDDATRIIVKYRGERIRVYVHPETLDILKTIPEEDRFTRMVFHFHGELLMGNIGSVFVELAASWAIIMIVTGWFLWWPRGRNGLGGILYPRLRMKTGSRTFWRDLHAVTGFWISIFVLFLLVTGLPWAKVWGEYFKEIRQLTGTAAIEQDWTVGSTSQNRPQDLSAEHLAHTGRIILPPGTENIPLDYSPIDIVLPIVRGLHLPHPVFIIPPARPEGHWTAKSDTQNRPHRVKVMLDATTGAILKRENFEDRHFLDRIIGFGVAAHEGQLFGWPNVILGVLTAVGLLMVVTSGTLMWWRRRPLAVLGAPVVIQIPALSKGFFVLVGFFVLYLPLFAASLFIVLLGEQFILPHFPRAAHWLGLPQSNSGRSRGN